MSQYALWSRRGEAQAGAQTRGNRMGKLKNVFAMFGALSAVVLSARQMMTTDMFHEWEAKKAEEKKKKKEKEAAECLKIENWCREQLERISDLQDRAEDSLHVINAKNRAGHADLNYKYTTTVPVWETFERLCLDDLDSNKRFQPRRYNRRYYVERAERHIKRVLAMFEEVERTRVSVENGYEEQLLLEDKSK
jgi:hypothetical protein